ncbi:hypothetical protein HBI23_027270 [Parastagonospora nodorum]|nr:hypothetical protein HBI79_011790 [Parastagonospora nodorum]KAH5337901.1 hypothetical protein HBI12_021530 [Parastagonospora nodorum]KAH5447171.1 hypothetical protein HBI47_018170 [Parastagonospora nodorum]KAH5688738.1 hypothetical protein HBI23_027270 [Parastagonospora nodorum]KAH6065433.1 hypothetical protein HBI67_127880 [Parastagonospora nodorum]
MYADLSPDYPNVVPFCCFSIVVPASAQSTHYSTETPTITPMSEYSAQTPADPINPLLAYRHSPSESMSAPSDASRLLQLQTSAAHPRTLQHSDSSSRSLSSSSPNSSPTNSRSSSTDSGTSSHRGSMPSPSVLACCRCRRESLMGMIQFSTNTYYCSHCARMVGYSAG